jgi:hypothetical protein
MIPLVFGLVVLVLALLYAIYFAKKEYFEDSLSSQPPEIVNLVMVTKDIPNAAPRAMSILQQFQEKKVSADEAIQQLYTIFKEGEPAHKKMMTKPYVSYFTDALDFAGKAMETDPSVPAAMKSSVKAAIQKFKTQMIAQSPAATVSTLSNVAAAAAVAPAPSESPIAANAATTSTAPTVPSMPAPSDARTIALINQQLSVMGIKPNQPNMTASKGYTAPANTDSTEQGMEYDNLARGPADKHCKPARPSCPEDNVDPSCDDSSPAPIDMNKYIRKDSIPCWGCTLPTTP